MIKRSKKCYEKNFGKFIDLEDQLLYELCTTDERRANALMKTSTASLGNVENKILNTEKDSRAYDHKRNIIDQAGIAAMASTANNTEINKAKKAQRDIHGSKLYKAYMDQRLSIYDEVFNKGASKDQKNLLRQMKKCRMYWQLYKEEDHNLYAEFAKEHSAALNGISKAENKIPSGTKPQELSAAAGIKPSILVGKDFDAGVISEMTQTGLPAMPDWLNTDMMKQKAAGLFDFKALKQTFTNIFSRKEKYTELLENEGKSEPIKINPLKAKTFPDRLFFGGNFDWDKGDYYMPKALEITGQAGYKIYPGAAFYLEVATSLNASEIGLSTNEAVPTPIVCAGVAGAMLDIQVWKIFYMASGISYELKNYKQPMVAANKMMHDARYQQQWPLSLKAVLPTGGNNSTSYELRYNLLSINKKPQIDFKIGILFNR